MFETFEQVDCFFIERKKYGIKPGLERIKGLLYLLNNPQNKVKAIHIAGTNGKGSTINFLKQSLIYNKYKVGVFTSPSLDGLTGHIFNNDEKISESEFIRLMNKIYPAIIKLDNNDDHPTEFEIITVLAFSYFVNSVDIALIETGMGGKDDTTNCFQPILSIITSIDKDHTAFLGDSLGEIATHKAGIIKHKTPVVIGKLIEEPRSVIMETARIHKAPVYELGKQFTYELVDKSIKQQIFKWKFSENKSFKCTIKMIGEHQVQNCSLALMALCLLFESGYINDLDDTLEALLKTNIPGRLEVIHEDPMIILDGAHNPAGIKSFLKAVDDYFPNTENHLLFASFKDKDNKQMLDLLAEKFSTMTITTFDYGRASSVDELNKYIKNFDSFTENNWKNFITHAVIQSEAKENVYFITGSLYFITKVRLYFVNSHIK